MAKQKAKTYTPDEIAELEAAREQATAEAHAACAKARPIKVGGRTFRPQVIKLANNPQVESPVLLADVLAWTCGGLAVHPSICGTRGAWQITHVATGLRVYDPNAYSLPSRAVRLEHAARILDGFDGWETLDTSKASPDLVRARDAVRAAA